MYNLFPKLHMRHEGFSFYGPKNSKEWADTILIYLLYLFILLFNIEYIKYNILYLVYSNNLLYLSIYIIINLDYFPCLV